MAVLHKLHTFVRHHSPLLFADISTFVAEVQAAVAAEMAEDRADTPGQHPGQPGSPVPAPAPSQQQAAVNSSQQNGGPTQDTHMTTADAFHMTTTSAMALALSDSQSLPGHQATTSLPLDISMAAASQCRTQSAGEPAVEQSHLQGVLWAQGDSLHSFWYVSAAVKETSRAGPLKLEFVSCWAFMLLGVLCTTDLNRHDRLQALQCASESQRQWHCHYTSMLVAAGTRLSTVSMCCFSAD